MELTIEKLNNYFENSQIKKDDLIDLAISRFLKTNNKIEKASYLILIGRCFRANKEIQYSIDYFNQAIGFGEKTGEALFWKACALNDFKQTSEAVELFNKAIQTDPNLEFPHVMLGIHYRNQGDLNQSKTHFLKAIKLNPELHKTHFGLSETLFLLNEKEQSELHLRKAVELGLNFASQKLQERFKIKTIKERRVYSDYFWDSYRNNGTKAHFKRSISELKTVISKASIDNKSDLSEYNTRLAELLFWETVIPDEAFAAIERAVDLSPDNDKAYFIWARLIEKRNTTDKDKISTLFAKSIELDSTNYLYYKQYALYHKNNGDPEKALNLFEKAHELYAFDVKVCEYLGVNYTQNEVAEKRMDRLRTAARYGSNIAKNKIKELTIGNLTVPGKDLPQEEVDKYYLQMELEDLISSGEYQVSRKQWNYACYYFHIARRKLEAEEQIPGGRLDRLLTDIYSRIGFSTPPPEGNEWLEKAIKKDNKHLGAMNTLAARYLSTDPEKATEIYNTIKSLNPLDIAANLQHIALIFKENLYHKIIESASKILQNLEAQVESLTRDRKPMHTILKQLSDLRWYLAKSYEETQNIVKQ